MYSTCFCPLQRKRKRREIAKRSSLFVPPVNTNVQCPSEKPRSNLPWNFYIFNDLVWLWQAVKRCDLFLLLHLRHCWLACLHLRQTFCQIPIHLNCTTLSAPVDDLLPYPSLSASPLPLCFRRHACWSDLDTDQTAFHLQGNSWLRNQFWSWARSRKGKGSACFAYPKNCFIVYPCANFLLLDSSDAKHRIFVEPSPLSSLKTIPQLKNIWKKHTGWCSHLKACRVIIQKVFEPSRSSFE